ncbi:MAG: ABC transporter ATP-binding protein [Thermoleophilia bacterium]
MSAADPSFTATDEDPATMTTTTTDTSPAPARRGGEMYALAGVGRAYGAGDAAVTALTDVSLEIARGEVVGIIGQSGSGKTTLLQLLGALDRPTAGTIRCDDRDLLDMSEGELSRLRRDSIGFVFQQFNLIPTLTARQNVEAAAASTPTPAAERRARASELLAAVGLAAREDHLPSQLSGGEQQRVAIARALVNRPEVILADEPTGNLDSTTGAEILALLRRIAADDGHTLVLITHSDEITRTLPRVITLRDGRVVSDERSGGGAPPA